MNTDDNQDKYDGFVTAQNLYEHILEIRSNKLYKRNKRFIHLLNDLEQLLDLSYHVASDSYPDEAISNLESFLS